MSDNDGFGDSQYWIQTLVQCLKESLGVFMFLVAYSRMGMFDTFTGPLVFYMVQVVLAFPFVNSYLLFLMRFGPWLKRNGDRRWGGRTLIQFVCIVGFQMLGSYGACNVVKLYQDK